MLGYMNINCNLISCGHTYASPCNNFICPLLWEQSTQSCYKGWAIYFCGYVQTKYSFSFSVVQEISFQQLFPLGPSAGVQVCLAVGAFPLA